jgi:hypothetical protein
MTADRPSLLRNLVLGLALATTPLIMSQQSVAVAAEYGSEFVPSGVIKSETREPGAFSRVALDGPGNVEVRQGTRESVTIKADDNLLPLIETTLEGSGPDATLHVRIRRNVSMRTRPHVDVVVEMVRVDAIALGGIGDIVAKGIKTGKLNVVLGGIGHIDLGSLDTDDLTLVLGGAGSIKADGRAASVKLAIAGSGNCETSGLASNDMNITIAGSGDAHVRAEKSLHVTIAGSGNVVYRGNATPTTTLLGSGTVKKG